MKERILTSFMWLGFACVVVWAFQSCAPKKAVFITQKAIFAKRAFHPVGKPGALLVQDGDTITLLSSTRKIKLKR